MAGLKSEISKTHLLKNQTKNDWRNNTITKIQDI